MNNKELQYWLALGFAEDIAAALADSQAKQHRNVDKHFKKKRKKRKEDREDLWK